MSLTATPKRRQPRARHLPAEHLKRREVSRISDIQTQRGDGTNLVLLVNGTCSEVQSIMYSSGSVLAGCGISAPVSPCDSNVLSSIYSGPVGNCPVYERNDCVVAPQYACTPQ
jgi:hypothetical protein